VKIFKKVILLYVIVLFYCTYSNANDSIIKNLGFETDFNKNVKCFLSNPDAWGQEGKEDNISFRLLKEKATADLLFKDFNVDSNGFCKTDMIMEIYYRDDTKVEKKSVNWVDARPTIQVGLDFTQKNEYFEIGYLSADGDHKWKKKLIFIEKNPRQMLRAINNVFAFKIILNQSNLIPLPISYVSLRTVNHQEFVDLREKDRLERGLVRFDYKRPVYSLSKKEHESFIVYPINYLQLIFPNSPIDTNSVGKSLKCFEVPGQAEPVSFVLHTSKDINNVYIKVSPLKTKSSIISNEAIDIRRVVYNDQRWGWGWSKEYGLCPDYLSIKNPKCNIMANANCQFWLTIKVPLDVSPALYEGIVEIWSQNNKLCSLPIELEVLPIKLNENKINYFVFHSPYFREKAYNKDKNAILRDMKAHGLMPVCYPKGRLIITDSGSYQLDKKDFEHELREISQIFTDEKEVFVGLQNFSIIWRQIGGREPRFQYSFPKFDEVYGKVLLDYAQLAKKYNYEIFFTFIDEPGADLYKRRASYLCASIAHKNGLKTWVDSYVGTDVQLELTSDEKVNGVNYLRPLMEVTDVFVCPLREIDPVYIDIIKKNKTTFAYYTTYMSTSVHPVFNRFLNGLYAFKADTKYVFTYAYRDEIEDPFDDMDSSSTHYNVIGMNDYLLTYPTWDGDILPTLSYEALREGIEDARILCTLQDLISKALKSSNKDVMFLGEKLEKNLNDILIHMDDNFRKNYLSTYQNGPVDLAEDRILKDLNKNKDKSYSIFDSIRRTMCDDIIKLNDSLATKF